MGVGDMKQLTGILLESPIQSTSTTSLKDYPRKTSLSMEMTNQEESPAAMNLEMTNLVTEENQTRSNEYMNHRCHGTIMNNEPVDPTRI